MSQQTQAKMPGSPKQPGLQLLTTTQQSILDDWADYPKNLPSYDPFLYDAEQLQQQVRALGTSVFDTETEVGFLDATGE